MIVIDKAGREVDVGGPVWIFLDDLESYRIDWSEVAVLPDFLVEAARRYAVQMISSGASSSVDAFFRMTVCRLLDCPSAQRPARSLTVGTFREFLGLSTRNKAASQRFRRFYRVSAHLGLPGFDRDTADVMDTMTVGAHRAPKASRGRSRGLTPKDSVILRDLLVKHGNALALERRVALSLCLQRGPNASPMALARGDLRDGPHGPEFGIPRHKKRLPHARAELHFLPIGRKLAADILALMARNAGLAAKMRWPDGSIGLPAGVAIPLFMRATPKPSHAAADRRAREFALHGSGTDVSELIRSAAVDLCLLGGIPVIDVTARVGRRTVTTDAQRRGLPPQVIARFNDHGSPRNVPRYAAEGLDVIEHAERAVGDRIRAIGAVPMAPKLTDDVDQMSLRLRKSSFRRK